MNDDILIWIHTFLKKNINNRIKLSLFDDKWVLKIRDKSLVLPISEWLYIDPKKQGLSQNDLKIKKIKYKNFFILQIHKKEIFLSNLKNDQFYYDFLGEIFWILNGFEDNLINRERDLYNRCTGNGSLAFKYNYLNYPVVDYIVEYLSNIFDISSKSELKLSISHDVDAPVDLFSLSNIKLIILDLFKLKFDTFFVSFKHLFLINPSRKSPRYYILFWLLSFYKKSNIKAFFFFQSMTKEKSLRHNHEAGYDLNEESIKELIFLINKNHHYLGIHISLLEFKNNEDIRSQVNNFKEILKKILNKNIPIINRTHFLQYDKLINFYELLESNDIFDDYSSGYADLPGFRLGTCKSFKTFRSQGELELYPLICMDSSIAYYMNKGFGVDFKDCVIEIAKNALITGGHFSILWHDNNLVNRDQRSQFISLISQLENFSNS